MVFALYGLAALMVAGGSWSVVQGLALVVLERGWTMVIAGSVVATGGVLLFAVARAIAGLGRIEAAMQRGLDRMARQALADAPPPRPSLSGLAAAMPEPPPSPAAAPVATPAPGLAAGLGAAAVAGALGQGEAAAEPRPFDPPRAPEPPRLPERPAPGDADPEPAALAPLPPDPLLADAPLRSSIVPTPEPPAGERSDEFGFAGLLRGTQDASPADPLPADPLLADAPPDAPRTAVHFDEPVVEEPRTAVHFEEPVVAEEPAAEEARPAEPVEEPVAAEEPEPAMPAEDEGAPEELTVIGTYSSGGNTYVMYSDGSIQADTPTGRYTFASLEELKDFIAGGGEAPADGGRA